MDNVLSYSWMQLQMNEQLVKRAIDGLTREELLRRPSERTNPMLWMVGHVAFSRSVFLKQLGGQAPHLPGASLFKRGEQAPADADYPETAGLVDGYSAICTAVGTHLETLTDEQLAAPFPMALPIPERTHRSAVGFMAFHESYHVGQIALVRKWLGHSALVG